MKKVVFIIVLCICPFSFYGVDYYTFKEQKTHSCVSVLATSLLEYEIKDANRICYTCMEDSVFYQSQSYASDWLSLKEYKKKDYIYLRNVRLPEYELMDSSMTALISKFIEEEKHQHRHYDKDGYILLCKESTDIWSFMSISPNMYLFSDCCHGSYDGVMHFCGHTFILSSGEYGPYPFTSTGKREIVEFLDIKDKQDSIWNYIMDFPDPIEAGFPIWFVRYDKDHYELMSKPGGLP